MAGRVMVTYHPLYDGRGFSPLSASWSRYRQAMDRMAELGILDEVDVQPPPLAEDIDLLRCHTRAHLEAIRAGDTVGRGTFATSDTPAWRGILPRARAAVGGTLYAARQVAAGTVRHVFNPGGGLHHAMRDQARGFCPFNDIAIAADLLATFGLGRVAIIDIDAHHGDGTQTILYDRDVLKISLHQYDGKYFPGTGLVEEVGWGAGYGLTVNVPLPRYIGEDAYVHAFCAIVPPAVRAFDPDVLIVNFGVDGHYDDRLSRLGLGVSTYRAIGATLHALAHEQCDGRLIVTGSGGYNPRVVASCWSVLVATLTGVLSAPDGMIDAMLNVNVSGRGEEMSALLRPLRATSAWPGPFAVLRDDPPAPDHAAVIQSSGVINTVTNHVLPIRLTRQT